MDGSEDPALVYQLDSLQEESATDDLVEDYHSSMTLLPRILHYYNDNLSVLQ